MSKTIPTRLQLEALRMRGDGMSDEEIAQELGLSLDAVKRRLRRARVRLGANDTAHAVAQCFRLGLFPPEVVADVS